MAKATASARSKNGIHSVGLKDDYKPIISAEQLQKRVRELGEQLSNDYRGKTLHVVGVLENSFVVMADLLRHMDIPVVCHFMKPMSRDVLQGATMTTEIFFVPEIDVTDEHVLLVEGVVMTGVTTEFLIRNLTARGAASVKLLTLLDRPAGRRVSLQPDYFGFTIDEAYVVGYGLGSPQLGRNLPYVAAMQPQTAGAK